MRDEVFQKVLETVFPILPEDWNSFIVRGLFSRQGSEIRIFIRDSSNTYQDCYAVGVPNEEVIQVSKSIYEELLKLRQSSEKEPWTGVTMVVDNEGNFTSDFDYSETKLFTPDYESAWENRYLK